MKIYIATRIENAEAARSLATDLISKGHEITYPWWEHGAVYASGAARIKEVATFELNGVERADAVIAILPGGRGTHVEIGAGIAGGKRVILLGDPSLFEIGKTICAFYMHPSTVQCTNEDELYVELDQYRQMDLRNVVEDI